MGYALTAEEAAALYRRHVGMVYQICLMLLKNVPDAEDAAQTVFRKAMERREPFRDPEHEKAWLIVTAKNECREILLAALTRCAEAGTLPDAAVPDFAVEIPGDSSHGDFAANLAMVSAKAFRKAPRMIAEALASAAELEGTSFQRLEVAGPGFLNFTLGPRWYGQVMTEVEAEGKGYGSSNVGRGEKVMVEFVSAATLTAGG